jgi:hypothetical protein
MIVDIMWLSMFCAANQCEVNLFRCIGCILEMYDEIAIRYFIL